ncbi:MAG: stage III sporulation protein AF [Firmicutes bacterium]|nr:stage III sporulation protein AF [Bacillota bacterium]
MIESLSQWVKNLITLVFVVTFLEMLTPDNDLKKFTRVVVGFFVLVAVISPLLDLVRGGAAWPEPEELFPFGASAGGSGGGAWGAGAVGDGVVAAGASAAAGPGPESSGSELEAVNARQATALYTARLAEEVRTVVKEILPDWEAGVQVKVSPGGGQVAGLEVALRKPVDSGPGDSNIEIPEVAITGGGFSDGPSDSFSGGLFSGPSLRGNQRSPDNGGASVPAGGESLGREDAAQAISERVRQRVASLTALSPEKIRISVMR